jgi:uncharacterized protein YbjT (DUF2867 family)
MARNPEHLRSRASSGTELVRGDVLEAGSLESALQGVHAAYYLIHSMGSGQDFERQDREGAQNFGAAARSAGVRQIIYLGGLGERTEEGLSSHLRSRHETGAVLRGSGVPVIELRTSIVLGSGSLSYELIRALVERLPIMICPRWVRVETQPIAIEDVIAYLVASLDLQGNESRVYEVGGADQVSYSDIMLEYARQRGLRRLLIPVPLLTPYLSSLWLGLTTPLYARVGRKLIESVRNPTVVRDDAALDAFPNIRPMGLTSAIERARRNEDREIAATRWSDALSSSGSQTSWGGVRFGTRLVDSRRLHVEASPARAFAPIRRIGGTTGWYTVNWLWRLRGFLDLLVGGVGMRRGRRDPEHLAVGDALDFWRVEEFEPDRSLRLRAEMKVPGRAWLEFEVEPDGSGSVIRQTAIFDPAGLGGLVYWYGIYPLHVQVFKGMLRGIGRMVE